MSSPKAAAKSRRSTANGKPKAAAKVAPRPKLVKPKLVPQNELSQQAIRLAREIERQFAKSDNALSVEAMQTLMSALCRVYTAQVAEEKKPDAVKEKIVEGKLKKFYQENVLLEQPFVKDDKVTVGDLVKALSGKTGEKVQVRRFARFELGGN